jgi:hypothetical protein
MVVCSAASIPADLLYEVGKHSSTDHRHASHLEELAYLCLDLILYVWYISENVRMTPSPGTFAVASSAHPEASRRLACVNDCTWISCTLLICASAIVNSHTIGSLSKGGVFGVGSL